MLTTCACGVHQVETEHANYVRNGVPLCNENTCQKVREHGLDAIRGRDPGDEDRIPEPYARSLYARFQDV